MPSDVQPIDRIPRILVVFAGGPHTRSRLCAAVRQAERLQPDAVWLTGFEFRFPEHRAEIARFGPSADLHMDGLRSTWTSCRALAADLHERFPGGACVTAVTSNYHAPRLRWLRRGLLHPSFSLTLLATPDLQGSDWLVTALGRRLAAGEALSWCYCAVLGFLCRCGRFPQAPRRASSPRTPSLT